VKAEKGTQTWNIYKNFTLAPLVPEEQQTTKKKNNN